MSNSQLPQLPKNISFASELIQVRSSASLTQAQLSTKSGISLSAIKGYETGRTMPGARELRELCQALQVSPNQLLFGKEDPFAIHSTDRLFSSLEAEDKYVDRFRLGILATLMTFEERQAVYTLMQGLVVARHGEQRVREMLAETEKAMLGLNEPMSAAISAMQDEIKHIKDARTKVEGV